MNEENYIMYRTSYSLYTEKTATVGLQVCFCGCHGPVLETQCYSLFADEYKGREQVPHPLGGVKSRKQCTVKGVQCPAN